MCSFFKNNDLNKQFFLPVSVFILSAIIFLSFASNLIFANACNNWYDNSAKKIQCKSVNNSKLLFENEDIIITEKVNGIISPIDGKTLFDEKILIQNISNNNIIFDKTEFKETEGYTLNDFGTWKIKDEENQILFNGGIKSVYNPENIVLEPKNLKTFSITTTLHGEQVVPFVNTTPAKFVYSYSIVASVPKMVVNNSGNAVFYNDNNSHEEEGYVCIFDENSGCLWDEVKDRIITVKFDSTFKKTKIHTCNNWFSNCYNLTDVNFNNLDITGCLDLSCMFADSLSLKNIDLSLLCTNQSANSYEIFKGCNFDSIKIGSNWGLNLGECGLESKSGLWYDNMGISYTSENIPLYKEETYTSTQKEKSIIIGNGTIDSYSAPMNNYYKYSTNETIYLKSELPGACNITKIAYDVAITTKVLCDQFDIYMANVDISSFSNSTSWINGLTKVYASTNFSIGEHLGWEEIKLQTPFLYNGLGNLAIVVCKHCQSYSNILKYNSTSASNRCLYKQNDNISSYSDPACGGTGVLHTSFANIKITYCSDNLLKSSKNLIYKSVKKTSNSNNKTINYAFLDTLETKSQKIYFCFIKLHKWNLKN